jgi:hypothetical protein
MPRRGASPAVRRARHPRPLWLCLALVAGCGSNSLVIGGDPERESLASDDTGPATGGSTATGGTAGQIELGPSGGDADRYPWVVWAQGIGYETSCPLDGESRGFRCWSHTEAGSEPCDDDGAPYCNACSCRVSCEAGSNCPSAWNGQSAECLGSDAGAGSCFVSCGADGACPGGMTCSVHPEFGREVCMWVDTDSAWQSMPK